MSKGDNLRVRFVLEAVASREDGTGEARLFVKRRNKDGDVDTIGISRCHLKLVEGVFLPDPQDGSEDTLVARMLGYSMKAAVCRLYAELVEGAEILDLE